MNKIKILFAVLNLASIFGLYESALAIEIDLRQPGKSMYGIPLMDQGGVNFCYSHAGSGLVSAYLKSRQKSYINIDNKGYLEDALLISPLAMGYMGIYENARLDEDYEINKLKEIENSTKTPEEKQNERNRLKNKIKYNPPYRSNSPCIIAELIRKYGGCSYLRTALSHSELSIKLYLDSLENDEISMAPVCAIPWANKDHRINRILESIGDLFYFSKNSSSMSVVMKDLQKVIKNKQDKCKNKRESLFALMKAIYDPGISEVEKAVNRIEIDSNKDDINVIKLELTKLNSISNFLTFDNIDERLMRLGKIKEFYAKNNKNLDLNLMILQMIAPQCIKFDEVSGLSIEGDIKIDSKNSFSKCHSHEKLWASAKEKGHYWPTGIIDVQNEGAHENPQDYKKIIYDTLNRGQPISVGICSIFLHLNETPTCHSRSWIEHKDQDGNLKYEFSYQCHCDGHRYPDHKINIIGAKDGKFLIRNSVGNICDSYVEPYKASCIQELKLHQLADIWVPEEVILHSMNSYYYLE